MAQKKEGSEKQKLKIILKEIFEENRENFKEKRNKELGAMADFLHRAGNNIFMAWLMFAVIISFSFSNLALMLILIDKGLTNLSMFGLINKVFGFLIALTIVVWVIYWILKFVIKKSEGKK